MKLNKGLGTVIGTVIFLLIAISVIGSLLLISYRSQLFATEISQAQTITSLKNAEHLKVKLPNNLGGNNGGGNSVYICVQNTGTVASQVRWVIVAQAQLINNQISISPVCVISKNVVIQPGQTVQIQLPTNTLTYLLNGDAVGVVTAYGNVFWNGGNLLENLGGG
ncbi:MULTISPECIES: hypothetical protein [Metallosphaera]|uniref:Uncharacterized protein n=3 Tax=Metallosphaera TaxID=41980 RepID=A4YG05_METS5|nr:MULTISPECIES: hypothetical protein [Metallosphaera]ABP95357.1 hypothetical protein Msed_1196 [Metallosphaera sedula DSM 5348]AIM27343.1 hypothetical protein HA72_1196 [Metallosphaera sedula]AKV74223.1 hypothetical protein MsedA_1214 [Metallosphaera sedula]AKV76462.1 hypothetical protein MsedB_1216 [Metallosphaera sedula]AKV78714.1 hypothetical protein MsedC_1214 [Metallosphaera sedula]